MSRRPNNDPPGGGDRSKRFKGTLVGYRVPERKAQGEKAPGLSSDPAGLSSDPAANRQAMKQTLLGGFPHPGSDRPPPREASSGLEPVVGPPFVADALPARHDAMVIPPPTATEVMLDPDRGDADDDPLELTPRPVAPLRSGTHPQPGGPSPASDYIPAARRYEGGSLRPEPAGPVRMNKWLYRLAIFGGLSATAALLAAGGSSEKIARLMLFVVWIPLVPTVLVQCVFLYKMWSAIDDRMARTTPGKAVGLMFVPLFNLYWVFEVLPGFATDYNAYLERHAIAAPRLDRRLFVIALLPVVGLCVFWYLIGRICDGVRALSH